MSLDFWAGYISGAAGILIGNPLDLVKVRLQAGAPAVGGSAVRNHFESAGALIRGAPAPILGYGALNALLFDSYHRALSILGDDVSNPSSPWRIWFAGVVGGLVTWLVSAPTEFVKCRAQLSPGAQSSWSVTKDTFRHAGLRGLYFGGAITSWRDSIGYGF
ncbi:MAG: hypothetical protein M1816_003292 [Peltula sp. TS41687]|nr:MAG: hypothetical protein M1816_003292 [Peltula sp. TS41687]